MPNVNNRVPESRTGRHQLMTVCLWGWLLAMLLPGASLLAAETMVHDSEQYSAALAKAAPGDTLVLANGVWRDFEIRFSGRGEAGKPITLRAETPGKVILSGRSNLRLGGEHLVVSGLVFRDGYTPTSEVIAFRTSKDELANHSRVTEVVIDHYNNPERYERDSWVMIYGRNNRFDHNHLVGKSNAGVTLAVRLDSEASQQNHHRIDHNYFGPRPVLGSNGGETIRIGTSHYSLTDSYTTVENNWFERCDGEVEIISNKSGRNTYRGNVFLESRGTLTLRHGNDTLVENNVFLGNRVDHTGGIRVINKRQTVRNNYLSGLTGYRFGGALVVMNGVPDSPINRYHQVEDTVIENNSILDSDHIELASGSDDERSAVPLNTQFRNNLIVNPVSRDSIAVYDDISGIRFSGNVADGVAKLPAKSGFQVAKVERATASNGLDYPTDRALAKAGAPRSLKVLPREQTGVSWYAKPEHGDRFAGGRNNAVAPGDDTLTDAVAASAPGDVLQLAPGTYRVTKFLDIGHPLTIRAATSSERPLILYERTTLIQLADGGSVQLADLIIDGAEAPDAYDNAVIRTSRYSMLNNYEVRVSGSEIRNLDVNHSFNFLRVALHTFADRIEISNSTFSDITGHVVALDREIDDLGIYNGEYLTIRNSTFTNIGGTVANLYRGGTDESTFGPHFLLTGSMLDNVGKNRRNKTGASVFLLGTQAADINGNEFRNSAPVRIVETVGEPRTTLRDNQLIGTEAPDIRQETL
jgi:poly(beta-D-mannuronate) lyase